MPSTHVAGLNAMHDIHPSIHQQYISRCKGKTQKEKLADTKTHSFLVLLFLLLSYI